MVVGMIMTDEEAADDTDQGAEAQGLILLNENYNFI